MGDTEEKIATMPAWPSCRALRIRVMPRAMARVAPRKTRPASRQVTGPPVRAGFQPDAHSTPWAASARVVRTADAAMGSMPVVIRGLIISVASD